MQVINAVIIKNVRMVRKLFINSMKTNKVNLKLTKNIVKEQLYRDLYKIKYFHR